MAEVKEAKETKSKKVVIHIESNRFDKAPVWVGVNGKHYLIQRDKDVPVPAEVAEVLKHSREMNALRYQLEAEAQEKNGAQELN